MKFLLDVNVGSTIAKALTDAGHDVVRAALTDARAEDPDLLARAVESRRILVTYDRDFSELIFSRAAERPPGIIYIRYEPVELTELLLRLIPLLDLDALEGHMTVIGARHTRRTPFPPKSNDNG